MKDKEGKDMGTAAAIKKIDKSNVSGLTKEKKDILKKQMGSISTNIDLNKVRDWWKNETD